MMNGRLLGAYGESLAAAAYRREGFELLEANYRTRQGEIDLIARKDRLLVFVEVKTRSGTRVARPGEFVTRRKQQRIILAAQSYLAGNPQLECLQMRFDVYEVVFQAGTCEETCIPDAFSV